MKITTWLIPYKTIAEEITIGEKTVATAGIPSISTDPDSNPKSGRIILLNGLPIAYLPSEYQIIHKDGTNHLFIRGPFYLDQTTTTIVEVNLEEAKKVNPWETDDLNLPYGNKVTLNLIDGTYEGTPSKLLEGIPMIDIVEGCPTLFWFKDKGANKEELDFLKNPSEENGGFDWTQDFLLPSVTKEDQLVIKPLKLNKVWSKKWIE